MLLLDKNVGKIHLVYLNHNYRQENIFVHIYLSIYPIYSLFHIM